MNFDIDAFSENSKIVMMAYAYCLEKKVDKQQIVEMLNGVIKRDVVMAVIGELVSSGVLVKCPYYYSQSELKLSDGYNIRMIKRLLSDENESLLSTLKANYKSVFCTSKLATKTRMLMSFFDSTVNAINPTYIVACEDEAKTIVFDKAFSDVVEKMPDAIIVRYLSDVTKAIVEHDQIVDWDYIDAMLTSRSIYPSLGQDLNIYAFYRYLATGDIVIDLEKAPADNFSLQIAAIDQLYNGNYPAAYKLFVKAMTINNKYSNEKGVFVSPISNYYFALTMVLADTDTARGKLQTMSKKSGVQNNISQQTIVLPLYHYYCQHQLTMLPKNKVNAYFAHTYFPSAPKWLGWLVMKRLGILDQALDNRLDAMKPNAAFLKRELAPTGKISDSDLKEIEGKMGSKSLAYTLPFKTIWEMSLENILKEVSGNELANSDAVCTKENRLLYIINPYGRVDMILQKRKKNGGWSSGRQLDSNQLLRFIDEDFLDDSDRRLLSVLDPWDYFLHVEDAIVPLEGCDHLYFGDRMLMEPVNVHRDKPYLVINKKRDGSFSVDSNFKPDNWDSNKPIYLKNSDTDYSVLSPTAYERNLYRQILSTKVYPAEAEPLLMKLISAIGGKTEIHSNMVVDLDDIETLQADSKITIRSVPAQGGCFSITLLMRLLEKVSAVPGKGNMTTIADKDGKKVQVNRNLKAERKNLAAVRDALLDTTILDEDDTDWTPETTTDNLVADVQQFLNLLEWTDDNKDVCQMEWPEGGKVTCHPAVNSKSTNISFKSKNSWFEVEGDVQIEEGQIISLQKLLQLMHNTEGHYIKIGQNEYIKLSNDLSKILKRLDAVTSEQHQHLQMAPSAVGLIGDLLDDPDLNIRKNAVIQHLRKRIEESTKSKPVVPKTLNAQLRDYQQDGFKWMSKVTAWGAGVCLADDMGLGKTLQTIALLLEQHKQGASLVVAPASVVPNWRNEITRFAPMLNVEVLNSSDDRAKTIADANDGDVIIATYAMLSIQQDELQGKEWNVLCLDEAHTIKNPATKMSKAAMKMQAKRKVILTGTPIQNHLSELWNLFQFINPGLLGSAEHFKQKFILPIEEEHNKERQSQLKKLITPFLLRRTKNEVIEELPEKNEIYLPVDLSSDEMAMYEVNRQKAEDTVKESKDKFNALAEITRLRQMACSISLVDKKWKKQSSKVDAFVELAESLNDSGNRALVFSQFTSFFDEVRRGLDKAGIPYLYLDGSTPMKKREQLVKEFQEGECPFFLISLKAGGLGLNLTGANYVIHLDPWWNPAIEQQATDRAYRIGQQQKVTVYHFIAQHTIEEKIIRLHKTKRDLADSLLEGSDMAHALTQEELLELLQEN